MRYNHNVKPPTVTHGAECRTLSQLRRRGRASPITSRLQCTFYAEPPGAQEECHPAFPSALLTGWQHGDQQRHAPGVFALVSLSLGVTLVKELCAKLGGFSRSMWPTQRQSVCARSRLWAPRREAAT